MNTGSLRARVTAVTLGILLLVLVVVVAAVTLAYRSSLERDLRSRLIKAGAAVARAGTGEATKGIVGGLALEGIATTIQPPAGPPAKLPRAAAPIKPGSSIRSIGSLLVLDETLPDGTRVRFSSSSSQITRDVLRLLVVEVVVAFLAFGLAALLLLRGTRRALQPLADVSAAAKRITAGKAGTRLRPSRTDTELGSMAAAFDSMLDALEEAIAQARGAEDAMRRFLADASHELRTPVAALQASAERLLREQPERPQRDEIEARLARDAARLGNLIDDLLGLARLEGAEQQVGIPLDLAQIAVDAVDEALRKEPERLIGVDARSVPVLGDGNGIRRIFRNLLDNSIAAVPDGGHIDLTVRRVDDHAEARISDDGPGIPEEDRERVFERFARIPRDDHSPGTGLGLAIARRIARQHGGDLTCDGAARGATFTLRLPAAPEL